MIAPVVLVLAYTVENRQEELKLLRATQYLERHLTRTGWSGSSTKLENLIRSYNRKFGTKFKTADDVLQYFKLYAQRKYGDR